MKHSRCLRVTLSVLFIVGLAACGNSSNGGGGSPNPNKAGDPTPSPTADPNKIVQANSDYTSAKSKTADVGLGFDRQPDPFKTDTINFYYGPDPEVFNKDYANKRFVLKSDAADLTQKFVDAATAYFNLLSKDNGDWQTVKGQLGVAGDYAKKLGTVDVSKFDKAAFADSQNKFIAAEKALKDAGFEIKQTLSKTYEADKFSSYYSFNLSATTGLTDSTKQLLLDMVAGKKKDSDIQLNAKLTDAISTAKALNDGFKDYLLFEPLLSSYIERLKSAQSIITSL